MGKVWWTGMSAAMLLTVLMLTGCGEEMLPEFKMKSGAEQLAQTLNGLLQASALQSSASKYVTGSEAKAIGDEVFIVGSGPATITTPVAGDPKKIEIVIPSGVSLVLSTTTSKLILGKRQAEVQFIIKGSGTIISEIESGLIIDGLVTVEGSVKLRTKHQSAIVISSADDTFTPSLTIKSNASVYFDADKGIDFVLEKKKGRLKWETDVNNNAPVIIIPKGAVVTEIPGSSIKNIEIEAGDDETPGGVFAPAANLTITNITIGGTLISSKDKLLQIKGTMKFGGNGVLKKEDEHADEANKPAYGKIQFTSGAELLGLIAKTGKKIEGQAEQAIKINDDWVLKKENGDPTANDIIGSLEENKPVSALSEAFSAVEGYLKFRNDVTLTFDPIIPGLGNDLGGSNIYTFTFSEAKK